MRIALAGNPNSGKTTMYNALTGRNEKVGNWAGVTVERKEHRIRSSFYGGTEELIAVDLPGAYSMSPFTSEESITSCRNTIKGYEMRLESREKAYADIKEELDGLRLDTEAKKRRVQILKELENNMEGFSHSVKTVMSQAETGLLRGICGPVSKLITVEREYSTAVETALAAAICLIVFGKRKK